MILHTVNKSPFTHSTLADCVALCADADSVLLIEDGVYGGQQNSDLISQRTAGTEGVRFFALVADVDARGLHDKLHRAVTLIDDREFVALSISHRTVQSWF